MMIDYTINAGQIAEIVSILGGGLFAVLRMSGKIDTKIALLHLDFTTVKDDMSAVKAKIEKVNDVLVSLADIRGELNVLRARMTALDQGLNELRHGDGWVQGRRGIDHEYPFPASQEPK
jgi:hypothetical protein